MRDVSTARDKAGFVFPYVREAEQHPTRSGAERPVLNLIRRARHYLDSGEYEAALEEAFLAGAYHEKFRASHRGTRGRVDQVVAVNQRRVEARQLFRELQPEWERTKRTVEALYSEIGSHFEPPLSARTIRRYVTSD